MFLKNKSNKIWIILSVLFFLFSTNTNSALASNQTSIMGETEVSKEQMIQYYDEMFPETYPQEYIDQGIELANFVDIIVQKSENEEVRADVVFAQILIETNYLKFNGEVSIEKNNFGNLQEIDESYISFDSIHEGVRANVQLLKGFASNKPLNQEKVYKIEHLYDSIEPKGMVDTVKGLGNGNWSEDSEYGETIAQCLEEMISDNDIQEPPEQIIEQSKSSNNIIKEYTESEVGLEEEDILSLDEIKEEHIKRDFTQSDKFFKADKNLNVYDNRTGSLVKVGEITIGQVYPRVRDYGANWHEIQFGSIKGYVYKPDTTIATGNEIKNINTSRKNQARTFKTLKSIPVYDNTSGSLVEMGRLDEGTTYPIAFEYGPNWWGVVFADRVGYVHKSNVELNFLKSDKYFRASENLNVYDNRTGSLVKVGEVTKGQVYPRVRDYGANWHEIQFGNIKGYVYKPDTTPATGNEIKNINTSHKNQARTFKTLKTIPVYDNTSGSLVEMGRLDEGTTYPIAFDYGTNWWGIIFSDRVGYVSKNNVGVEFFKSDRYFRPTENLNIYDNRTGSLVKVGEVTKGQVYPRLRDYGANWHEIQFGNIKGYVYKPDTTLATGNEIKNINTSRKNQTRTFKTLKSIPVYDNTSGTLVEMGRLDEGTTYPIAFDYGPNWWGVIFSDRRGYVHKNNVGIEFFKSDDYFRVTKDTPIYDNRTGSLVKVGELTKGQVYPRVRDYGANWHEIQFGNIKGYVYKPDTTLATGNEIKNINTSRKNQARTFKALKSVPVYDNTSGSLVQFGTIEKGVNYYPVSFDYGNWWGIIFSDRIGYVHKNNIEVIDKINIVYSNYNQSLNNQLSKQMKANPQTDFRGGGWQDAYKSEVEFFLDPNNLLGKKYDVVIINTQSSNLNMRSEPNTKSEIIDSLEKGNVYPILEEKDTWYKIKANNKTGWVSSGYVKTISIDEGAAYQFLDLSKLSNISTRDLEQLLKGKGILDGFGYLFKQASQTNNINEIYLIAHASLETGNGTSKLSTGIMVDSNGRMVDANGILIDSKGKFVDSNGKRSQTPIKGEGKLIKVYNMFGIGAYDDNPAMHGASRAFKEGWTTPEAAIIGGAKFVSENYIHNKEHQQNTLYKMRWNPGSTSATATHQYASDIGWAYKQGNIIKSYYDSCSDYVLYFDIPVYR